MSGLLGNLMEHRMDLERLTPEQEAATHRFLDLLQAGQAVTALDFPELPQAEFEALANAIAAATKVVH